MCIVSLLVYDINALIKSGRAMDKLADELIHEGFNSPRV